MEKVGFEISVFEDFTSVFIQPEAYQKLVSLSMDVDVPILVPSSLDVFADIDAYVAASYGAVGNDPTQIPALDSAQPVTGVNLKGMCPNNRFLMTAEVTDVQHIEGTSEFVLGSVSCDIFGDAVLVMPKVVVEQHPDTPIVWCACDKLDSMADYVPVTHLSPRDPYVMFRLGVNLASQYAPVTLWQLMVDVGESWSSLISLLTTMQTEGYRIRRTKGAAELYFLEQTVTSHMLLSPMMDSDGVCEALLAAVDSLLGDSRLRNDPSIASAANVLARQVISTAPTRALAKFLGREVLDVPQTSVEGWPSQQPVVGCPAAFQGVKLNAYDSVTWAQLNQSRSLIRATLCSGAGDESTSVFAVGSLVGEYVELECVVSSRLLLVHPSDLRDISVVGHRN